jgi:hypothetical protein
MESFYHDLIHLRNRDILVEFAAIYHQQVILLLLRFSCLIKYTKTQLSFQESRIGESIPERILK